MAYYETDLPTVVNGGNGNCNNGGFFGNDGFWAGIIGLIAVAAIFGGNGGGLFGGGNRSVDSAVQRGFDTNGIMNKLEGINSGLCDGFYAMNTGMLNGFSGVQQTLCQGFSGVNTALMQQGYETRNAINGVSAQLASCCCDLSRGQERIACDIERSTNAIVQSGAANTQRILDFLCNEKISALQSENALLTSQLSQNAQTRSIIEALQPVAKPAYITCSPYESSYGFGRNGYGYGYNNGCGCGCGCGCNG